VVQGLHTKLPDICCGNSFFLSYFFISFVVASSFTVQVCDARNDE
jgi:hypothetical protein